MVSKVAIDDGHAFDWGKTSNDYAVYRPGYPESFYAVLHALGIGRYRQDILDLGTGTGVLARAFARQGAHVIGIDIAETQIVAAQQLAAQENLQIRFVTCAAENADFPNHAFDIISCGQSWLYFDTQIMSPLVKRWLKPGGKLVLTHLSWLPRKDRIAQASKQLIRVRLFSCDASTLSSIRLPWCTVLSSVFSSSNKLQGGASCRHL